MTKVCYLDANATQPLRPEARQAVLTALEVVGNPSSVHGPGREARRVMEDARETIARHFGVLGRNVVFTSGGTEANATAIYAMAGGRRLITSAVEHDAVRSAAPDAAIVPVGRDGVVILEALDEQLRGESAALVCLMLANNETGVIQPVSDAAEICRRHGALLHVDAVQAAGRIPVRFDALGAHSLTVSSHKLGGPAGVGALLLAPDAPFTMPLIGGGGQEMGRRGGTPPVALIAGFAAAMQAANRDDLAAIAALRDTAEAAAVACGAVVCGDATCRLSNTTCIGLPGAPAAVQVMALDLEKVSVSAGSACSSGKVQASHVLRAMNLGTLAGQAIRVSLPWDVTPAMVGAFVSAYQRVADRLRRPLARAAV